MDSEQLFIRRKGIKTQDNSSRGVKHAFQNIQTEKAKYMTPMKTEKDRIL